MNDIYAMRRANGDWFVIKDQGRVRLPLFHSSHDAMMARLRNFGMLLFQPVALDDRLLGEIAPGGEGNVDFCMVRDPFASLKRSPRVERSQLALLVNRPDGNGKLAAAAGTSLQSEWWN